MNDEQRNATTERPAPPDDDITNPFAAERPTLPETPSSRPPLGIDMATVEAAIDKTARRVRKEGQEDLDLIWSAVKYEFGVQREQFTRLRLEAGMANLEREDPNTLTVLIADDEEAIRKLLVRVMMKRGYRVLEASNGEEAVDLLDKSPSVDVVVTDLAMPLNGVKFAEHCAEKRPTIGLVMMSGHLAPPVLREGARFLAKPFGVPEILQAVERAAAERPRGGP